MNQDRTKKAQHYHATRDVEASKEHHQQISVEEGHGSSGDIIKSLVFGGLDGIITTFAIVCAVQGSENLGSKVVIMMGIANLVADAISMGLGDYLSEKAENEYVAREQDREEWEMDNFLEGELSEMADIYVSKGFSRPDAVLILNKMVQNKQFFLEHMMVEELGLMPVDPEANPGKKGLVTFVSFMVFGSVPLVCYIALYNTMDKNYVFAIASSAVACTLFTLGCLKAKLVHVEGCRMIRSGLETLGLGSLACTVSYLVGWGLEKLLDVTGCE
jgi:DNA damage-binding protein 1